MTAPTIVMHTYWRGFAQCAKALLDGSAQVMALHDKASNGTRCTKCHKQVIPVLDLEPGVRFIPHVSPSDVSSIVAQGGAA